MNGLVVNLDFGDLKQLAEDLRPKLLEAARKAGQTLAPAMHAHLMEKANEKLHSRRQLYIDNLSFKQENEDTWFITLGQKARWIDDGQEPHEMIDDLLTKKPGSKGKGPQTAKDGSTYRVIPFNHGPGKGPTVTTPAQQTLQATIKKELAGATNKLTGEKGIPFGKIEKDNNGQPRLGLLHSLDINHSPVKTGSGPGQGWGNIGSVRQGYTGIPFLQGVRIYQREVKNQNGTTSVKRAVMTFRIVSSKMKGSGRWFHPGSEPLKLMDETYEWGQRQWDSVMMPKILDAVIGGL